MIINDELLSFIGSTENCIDILSALGDETRIYILIELLKMYEPQRGARAVEIADKINLSRPAVSHHLQILKDAGILKARTEGVRIYYCFDKEAESIKKLSALFCKAIELSDKYK